MTNVAWVKSNETGTGVEVSMDWWGIITARSTRRPGIEMFFSPDEWDEFLVGACNGTFSLTALQEARDTQTAEH